uniref:Ribosomal protein S7 n=1 Tax=Nitzschia sp. (in: diatoms) TaxID=1884248 RepID=A0A2U9GIU9_9STRA|nr:ribosomal protein S7 [Nitzschia sp. (in: diatoms)]AWQ64289.1 ribosomal protein S7 [Nitzschia sp. (in: diatoms)]
MIKSLKTNKNLNLKSKIINTLMISGKKSTGEKIVLKFAKQFQKLSNKNFKNMVQLAIINSTPTFKLNEQIVKKGKRKAVKSTPIFITSDSLRIITSLKFIRNSALKNKNSTQFYESLVSEILASANSKSQSVDKKNELQKQILLNKRYLSKFRW